MLHFNTTQREVLAGIKVDVSEITFTELLAREIKRFGHIASYVAGNNNYLILS